MKPSLGRVVHYQLTSHDAVRINGGREPFTASDRVSDGRNTHSESHSHSQGNPAREGDVFPLVITKIWAGPEHVTEETAVNGQVFLDGNDTLWLTSVSQGDGFGHWHEPPSL